LCAASIQRQNDFRTFRDIKMQMGARQLSHFISFYAKSVFVMTLLLEVIVVKHRICGTAVNR
jgi:hypothetical protein